MSCLSRELLFEAPWEGAGRTVNAQQCQGEVGNNRMLQVDDVVSTWRLRCGSFLVMTLFSYWGVIVYYSKGNYIGVSR